MGNNMSRNGKSIILEAVRVTIESNMDNNLKHEEFQCILSKCYNGNSKGYNGKQ